VSGLLGPNPVLLFAGFLAVGVISATFFWLAGRMATPVGRRRLYGILWVLVLVVGRRPGSADGSSCRRRGERGLLAAGGGDADCSSEHVLGGRSSRLNGAEAHRARACSILGAPAGTSSQRAPRRLRKRAAASP
jgi:hypothetical protein